MNKQLLKDERLARTGGIGGWFAALTVLGIMCADQFLLDLPFENVIFPLLVICAASMSFSKNVTVIAVFSVLFELGCLAFIPANLIYAKWWLLEVFIGFSMPYIAYKAFNGKRRDTSVFAYAAIAAVGQLLYYWVSVIATVLIWKVPFAAYLASDIFYELVGAAVTFLCAIPVSAIYKSITGELKFKRKFQTA